MNVMEYLPKFKVKGEYNQYYFIQLVKGNRIMAWEQKGVGDCTCELVMPKNVEGGKETLVELDVWNKLSEKERFGVDGKSVETNKEITMDTNKVDVITSGTVTNKVAKAVVMIRLLDGTVRARTKGRQPAGSVVVTDVATTPVVVAKASDTVVEDTKPVTKIAKTDKAVVMIRLLDGTVRARTKGRQPAGSVVVTDDVATTPVVVAKAKVETVEPVVTPVTKAVVMIRLLDGTVRARTKGRQPAGSVVVTEGV